MLPAHMLRVSPTEDVWARFSTALLAYLRRRVADDATAQDLLQDVFLKVHTNLDAQPAEERLAPWVYRIAKNTLIDHHRRTRPTVAFDEQDGGLLHDSDEPPPHEALERSLGAWLRSQIAVLPEPYREALRLTEIDGLSQQDAAARLGLPYSTFKSRVQRGRDRLAKALRGCCRVELDAQGRVLEVTPHGCDC